MSSKSREVVSQSMSMLVRTREVTSVAKPSRYYIGADAIFVLLVLLSKRNTTQPKTTNLALRMEQTSLCIAWLDFVLRLSSMRDSLQYEGGLHVVMPSGLLLLHCSSA